MFAKITPDLNILPEDLSDLNLIALAFFTIAAIFLLIYIAIYLLPHALRLHKEKSIEKEKSEKDIRFDKFKSVLHLGSKQLTIPESSLEYYVCKLVFENPKTYHSDLDILDEAGEPNKKDRAVYFAVDRINKKANRELKLKYNLFKRNRERTRLNDNYF